MHPGDTIAAIATGSSPSGATHALLRLSGPDAIAALSTLLTDPPASTRHSEHVVLKLGNATLPATLMVFPGPRSFTGEHCAELIVPANAWLLDRLMHALCAHAGVRPAEPGEFSARAYLAGRLSLSEAEGLAALIAADNQSQLAAAEELAQGRAGEQHQVWAHELTELLALTEAGIDFTDQEDVVAIAPADLSQRLGALRDAIVAVAPSAVRTGAVRVALVGPPNAGKSTLFNALLGKNRAITSDRSGTTRDAIVEPLDLRPICFEAVELVDLPGLDASADGAIAEQAQLRAHQALDRADVLLVCTPAKSLDAGGNDPRAIHVRTKADRPSSTSSTGLAVCAIDGFGLADLRTAITQRVNSLSTVAASGAVALAPRHASALREAAACLVRTLDSIDASALRLDDSELVAGDLRAALDAMAPLVGRVEPDEVLGLVFGAFCIGK